MQGCGKQLLERMCTACKLNAVDNWKHTALDYCIRKGDVAKSELMVKNGARVDPVLLLSTKRSQCAFRSVSNASQFDVACACMSGHMQSSVCAGFPQSTLSPSVMHIGLMIRDTTFLFLISSCPAIK
jgi:hypothetical protein